MEGPGIFLLLTLLSIDRARVRLLSTGLLGRRRQLDFFAQKLLPFLAAL
jgi:hypothetical protein